MLGVCRPPTQKPKRTGAEAAPKSREPVSKAAPTVSKLPRGYVECPSCTMQLREALLNDHLDK